MKKIKLIAPNKIDQIEILYFLEDFFLKRGYKRKQKNFFYFKFIIILKKYFSFIKKIKLILSPPKKKEIIVYDSSNKELLLEILPKEKTFVLPVRKDEIKEIFISFGLFLFLLKNFFKNTIKQNYLIYLIRLISPKIVITAVENSGDFHVTSKSFRRSKIKFFAVQHSDLRGSDYVEKGNPINKLFFIPTFFCFSNYDKELFEKTDAKINKFIPAGSLKASIFLKKLKEKKISLNENKYDICLIGEPASRTIDDLRDLDQYYEIPGKIAKFTLQLCKKNNLSLVFSGKNPELDYQHLEEVLYYKYFLKDHPFDILPKKNSLSTFENAFQSKLIIGHASTFLREISAINKKVLQLNLSGHNALKQPFSGISYLEKFSYEIFEERVMTLLSMEYTNFKNKLIFDNDYVVAKSDNAISNILKEVLN